MVILEYLTVMEEFIMESVLYNRVKELCEKRGITISKFESDLGFGNSSIKKWRNSISPSVDKIIIVANYFDVSVDYLLGRTDIVKPVSEVIGDKDVISFQRARDKMTERDKDRMMQMLKIGFEYAFQEEE